MAVAPIKILTLNCRGLNNKIKAKRMLSTLVKQKADIIFLQETHLKKTHSVVFNWPEVFRTIFGPWYLQLKFINLRDRQ